MNNAQRERVQRVQVREDLDPTALHTRLARFNQRRLRPMLEDAAWRDTLASELELRLLEGEFVERERRLVAPQAAQAPREATAFLEWFEDLQATGPGQGDKLFPWLAGQADLQEMKWFLTQEVAGEAGFDDLMALTQVKAPTQAKLEMARNYWDELGRGSAHGMHGPMLEDTAAELGLVSRIETTVWEALALGNLMVALATNRRYAYQSIGALGAVELTAPGRVSQVNEGLQRLGVAPHARRYFALHATLDVKHAEAWSREVLHSLVQAEPAVAVPLAEGALLRLQAGARCFTRYREALLP